MKAMAVMRFPKAIMINGQARSGILFSQEGLGLISSDITVITCSSSSVAIGGVDEVKLIVTLSGGL